ncbi:receptor-type tyrosine-protein phosphatase T-like [Haliotis rufescens]|uniref:receptor-type tyrosine-protein phosphatase T-like n=1 Tax=Haliotis rufescens TaxID=6454 RepID=UPI00201EB97F|nr:receptor-type tyrosine-protein phosphatase T-like [Haliotis rufescens]
MKRRKMACTLVFVTLLAVLQVSASRCRPPFFGDKCQYQCHCALEAPCDAVTGSCNGSGCALGWMGPLCQYLNLAYDLPASASPVLNSPQLAVDGDINTCFETLATSGSPSWQVNLETNQWITWIRIHTATTTDLLIELDRLDGNGDVITSVCNSSYNPRHRVSAGHLDIRCKEPILARWVKIIRHVNASPRLQLCEVEVGGGRNVALKKRTYQSSTWGGPDFINGTLKAYNFTSDLAVDGSTATDFTRGSCTVTNVLNTPTCREGTTNPSWAVDLGQLYDIYSVVVYNRGDPGLTNRLAGFSLLTSGPEYMEIYRDVTNNPALVTEVEVPGNLTADGVLLRLYGCRILTLCEVEVYGDCLDELHGLECNNTCQCRDEDEACGKLDGQCLSGCPDGYTGLDCTQLCRNGTYGLDCNKTCNDNCLDDSCHPVTGRCTDGCEPGWIGPMCNKACSEGWYGPQCELPCNRNCHHQLCYAHNGSCSHGCSAGWMGVSCHRAIIGLPFFEERSILIGALVGAFIFVIGLIIVIIFLKRRHKPVYSCREAERRRKGPEHPTEATKAPEISPTPIVGMTSSPVVVRRSARLLRSRLDMSYVEDDDLTGDEEALVPPAADPDAKMEYYNLDVDKSAATAVRVADFPAYMDKWRSNKYHFQHRFLKLPRDYIVSCDVASADVNRHKNRYLNILPYDHCRVVLDVVDGDPTSDYINASHILSYNKKASYIASQGPNKAILADFVRMIWEKKVTTIVMLTNLVEEGRRKCEAYWNCEEDLLLGDITVTVVHEDTRAHYTARTLKMSKLNSPSRTVTQLHFTAWPDKGVPQSAWSLVYFRHKVKVAVGESEGPVLVHCSAGVGRTGTFIALENLLEEAALDDDVDVFVVAWKLRQQRVNMVQTLDQFVFLHEALLAALVAGSSYLTPATLLDQFHIITSECAHKEFKDLKTCPTVTSEKEFISAKAAENRRKNRYYNILPLDSYRPHLHTDVNDAGNDYINAVLMPSFRHPRGLLVTQTPLPHTVLDFWRLVYDHGVSLIIMIDNINDDQDVEDFGVYWPEHGETMEIGPFLVSSVSDEEEEGLCVRNLHLVKTKAGEKTRVLRQFHCMDWPDTCDLPPYDVIKSCVDAVRVEGAKQPLDPVLVHCRDGAKRSGVFCVLVELLEELESCNTINVPLAVGGHRSIRQQVVSHLRQYEAVYELLRHHMKMYPDIPDFEGRGRRRHSEGPIYMNQ